jgi:hypothetical protein
VEGCKLLELGLLSAQYSSAAAGNGSRGGAQADQFRTPPLAPFKRHGATSGVALVYSEALVMPLLGSSAGLT